ncbi:hypothetical protein [Saccharolobus shibatae]|uniref:Uncharacterized protein n=1 Tax=Saccharolobus shibatae TaxID=2286 RepID=A0A8F5GWH2_9CREN|nr:hypothetical protein [Saccharolobus shibatae]QXJ32069.1 hypothetical protein J5U21_01720 [Saccharolobus shibatae]
MNRYKIVVIAVFLILASIVAIAAIQIKTVNSYSISGYGLYETPYRGGVLISLETLSLSNIQSSNISIPSAVYYANSSYYIKIASYTPNQVNTTTFPIATVYNNSFAVINTLYINITELPKQTNMTFAQLISRIHSNITILNGLNVVSWKFFDNFTIAYPSKNGITYVSIGVNKTVVITPEKVYVFKNESISEVYPTKYGYVVITGIQLPSSNKVIPLITSSNVTNISLVDKWHIVIKNYEGSTIVGNYLLVSNKSTTLLLNLLNGNIIYELPFGGNVIYNSSIIINNVLYGVIGNIYVKLYLNNGSYNKILLPNITSPSEVQFINNSYVLVSGLYTSSTTTSGFSTLPTSEVGLDILYVNGTIAYSNLSTPTKTFVFPISVVYSSAYLYKLSIQFNFESFNTQVDVLSMQNLVPPATTTTSTTTSTSTVSSTTTSSTSTTTSTSTISTTSSTTTSTTTSSTSTTTTSTTTSTSTVSSTTTSSTSTTSTTSISTVTPSSSTSTSHPTSFPTTIVIVAIIIIAIIAIAVVLLLRR